MACPHCHSTQTRPHQRTTKLGYKTFFCGDCRHSFNERTGTLFNDLHLPSDIVYLVVLWRLRYRLSLRDIPEMFAERGFRFTHEAVRDWERRFAPLITTTLKAKRRYQHSEKWRMDEAYIKINGKQHYLYRAVDGVGTRIDVRLSETRDMAAAVAFFEQVRKTVATKPKTVITDKHVSYPKAIRQTLGRRVEHRQSKYLNNRLEQDHRGITQRIAPMGGFKTFESAKWFCSAYDEQRNYLRYRANADESVPLWKQRNLFWQRFSTLRKEFVITRKMPDQAG